MIRRGYYCRYKGKIFPCVFINDHKFAVLRSNDIEDVRKRNFEINEHYKQEKSSIYDDWNTKYSNSVPIEDIDWFCSINTIGYYKGYKVVIKGESLTEYSIMTGIIEIGNKVFTKENGFDLFDRQTYVGKVPKSEITNIT